ncbi:MAG TPA: prolyl oligopeptidase family serine peptidase [Thermoanaerobaculia bacterium]|nr:prolyl oligopeptidase family serine peptidase [Thermoanaerobaculia bacterium]
MKTTAAVSLLLLLAATAGLAEVPSNLVVDGVPEFPAGLEARIRPYLDNRTAAFASWNPARPEMLIRTRFGETTQLHLVKMPGGARTQLTFLDDRASGGSFRPGDPNTILFGRDAGGNEMYQVHRYDVSSGEITLLTDGKSRNIGAAWSRDGKWFAFSSTRRNGRDTDIWIMNPSDPSTARMVLQVEGGGWFASDFSLDGSKLLVTNYTSANESDLYLVETGNGRKTHLTPKGAARVSYSSAKFSADDSVIYFTSDEGGEFHQLRRMRLSDRARQTISNERWDIGGFDLSHDRTRVAYSTNENGASRIKVAELPAGKVVASPQIPLGVAGGLDWHPNGRLIGFTLSHAKSPSDAYSYDVTSGKLERWTESETGGLNRERNAEPQLITTKSFDGTEISAFVYRPDAARFPGKRPVVVSIHGGPEGQSRPGFLGRNNFWINELGVAMVYPNVRGSDGYGKTFLAMDNAEKREDSVRDIGAILDWIARDPRLDASRVGVYGGSYGGYMVLASMIHFADRLEAGIDVVGISSFLTFLQNTSGYRRDLRRAEYGDERDPAMRAHLEKISPLANAAAIRDPLFVIMGFNDPRVPYTEGEQIVGIVRESGAPVWYLMAKDEGHGFAKRQNQDFQFTAMTMFWQQHLLD